MKFTTRLLIFGAVSILLIGCGKNGDYTAYLDEAQKIHQEIFNIDTHIDTPMNMASDGWDIGERHDPEQRGRSRVDLPRMREGGLDAAFFAVYVGQRERTPENYQWAKERADEAIQAIYGAAQKYPQQLAIALTPEDALGHQKQGLVSAFLGLENGFPIGTDLANLQKYYERGIRYVTLCHTKNNDICDSSTDEPEHDGLSEFGRKVVREMNRLGIIVDVSHISDKSFYDVLEVSKAPVVASHSCARAIADNPRNLSDDMLIKLAEKGGVMQLCILSDYVKKMPENPEREAALKAIREKYGSWNDIKDEETRDKYRAEWYAVWDKYPRELATVKDAVDHIDHVVNLVGIDFIGIGTDFDGGGGLADCRDVSELPNITAELLRRGYSKEDIEKIWGGNFLRVFNEVINVAQNNISAH